MVQRFFKALIVLLSFLIIINFWTFLRLNRWFDKIEVDYQIAPVDVFSLIVSTAVTIWLGTYVVKKLTEQRYEKELLIRDLQSVEQEVKNLEEIFESSTIINLDLVASKMNIIKHLLERFSHTLSFSNSYKENEIEELNTLFYALYNSSTNFTATVVSRNSIDTTTICYNADLIIRKTRELALFLNKK